MSNPPTPSPTPLGTTLIDIVTGLSEVYDDRSAAIWLKAGQMWDGEWFTAMSMVANGRATEVMQKVDQLRSGAYS